MVWRHNQLRERGWDVGVSMCVQAAACELLLFLLWALFVVRHNSYRSFETPQPGSGGGSGSGFGCSCLRPAAPSLLREAGQSDKHMAQALTQPRITGGYNHP